MSRLFKKVQEQQSQQQGQTKTATNPKKTKTSSKDLGEYIDYEEIEAHVISDIEKYDIELIGFDPDGRQEEGKGQGRRQYWGGGKEVGVRAEEN